MSQFTCTFILPAIPSGEGITSRRLSRSINGGGFSNDDFGIVEANRQYVVNAGTGIGTEVGSESFNVTRQTQSARRCGRRG